MRVVQGSTGPRMYKNENKRIVCYPEAVLVRFLP
jgi:hypothetical protein